MSDDMMILSGKLRIETAQFTSGVKAAAAETRTSADNIVGSMSRVTKAANDAARGMSEASAHIAASSWASRRAAEQEAETRRQVATVYKDTETELKKHRTYEQAAAAQKIRTLQAEGWAAKRAAEQEVEAFRTVGKAAQESERNVSRARATMRDYIAENNKLGGSGRQTIDNPFTFRGGSNSRIGNGGGGGNTASASGGGFMGAASRVGGPYAMALAAGTAAATFGLRESMEAEVSYTRLQSVLKATGGQAGRTADQITAMGSKIQQTTIYTDNAAIKAQTFLATLDNLSGKNFDDATKAAADLASVMEIDLESAAQMVGRALQDPENGLRALASAGVKFTDQQKAVIKSLMETGDMAGAQRVILDELAHRMGGSAADAAKTMSGRLQQATNDVASLGQTITEKLLHPLQAIADLDKSVGEGIAKMIDPEAAKGLENKPGGAAFDRERKLKAYLSSVDTSGMANNVKRDDKGKLQLDATGIAEHTAKFNAMSAADQEKYNYEDDKSKAYDTTGKWDNRTQAQQTDARLRQNMADDRNRERLKQEAWAKAEEARTAANLTPQARAERAANFAQSAEGAESLKTMPSEQGKAFLGGLVTDVKALGSSATNTGTTVGANGVTSGPQISQGSQQDIDATLKRYRVMFEQMPQFSAEAWKKIEADLQFNLRNASISADEQKEFYLKNAELVAQGAAKIFDEYDKKREEQVKKDAERAKHAVAKIDPSQLPGNLRNATHGQAQAAAESMGHDITGTLKPDENGVIDTSQVQTILDNYKAVLSQMPRYSEPIFKEIEAQVVASAKAAAESTGAVRAVHLEKMKETLANAGGIVPGKTAQIQAGGAADPYAALAGASKQDLSANVAQRNANVQTTRGIGLGTPEQKRGMIELAQLQAQTMKAIQNSTGETRQKNIEELKRLDEAWATAYKKIREGSKETVTALTADSKKQGDAMTGAAAKAGKQQQRGQDNGVGDMMAGINQMSQGLSNLFMGAMSGLGGGAAAFGEYLNSITDPVERIDAQISQAKAKLQGAAINAQNFGSATATSGMKKEIADLEGAKTKLLADREAARKEAFRQDRAAKLIHTADEASSVQLVGARAQTDLYGPGFREATGTEKATPGPQSLSVSVIVNGPVSPDGMLTILDNAAKQAGWDRSGRSFLRSANGRT